MKKKCVSTTNLKYTDTSSSNSPCSFNNQNQNHKINNFKSVTFLDESNEATNDFEQLEIVVNENEENNNNQAERILKLESSLKQKINEINQLKFKANQCRLHRN